MLLGVHLVEIYFNVSCEVLQQIRMNVRLVNNSTQMLQLYISSLCAFPV